MTKEEFNIQKWGAGMKIIYHGKEWHVISVNFPEMLVGFSEDLDDESLDNLHWARCENIQLLTWNTKE